MLGAGGEEVSKLTEMLGREAMVVGGLQDGRGVPADMGAWQVGRGRGRGDLLLVIHNLLDLVS